MANEKAVVWVGFSGIQYIYWIYPLSVSLDKDLNGNYIFAKATSKGWIPIYIGQGNLHQCINEDVEQLSCIRRKGATHVHLHTNEISAARWAEAQDLLVSFAAHAYTPWGCNQAPGDEAAEQMRE